jgi:MFS transporter, DHA1 family, multidrug resistance protein
MAGVAALIAGRRLPVPVVVPVPGDGGPVGDRQGNGRTAKGGLGALLRGYAALLGDGAFIRHAVVLGGTSGALYLFLGSAPFLLEGAHGLPPGAVGLCLLLVSISSIAGTRLVGRLEARGAGLAAGATLGAVAALLFAALQMGGVMRGTGLGALIAFLAPVAVMALGAGMLGPMAIARIIRASPGREGMAASLAGATQMLTAAGASLILTRLGVVDERTLAIGMALALGCAFFATVGRRISAP